jgi:DNA-binding transcriptional LysR family regulator
MLPTSAEIEYFLEIAKTLNITRASERLGVSQPTLTLSLKKLEDRLGAPLLIRKKSGVELTKFGLQFQTEAKALIEQWQRIRQVATREEQELRGRYTIGVHPSVAIYAIPEAVRALLQRNSGLELQLVHDLSRKITEQVISARIDLGIVVNPIPHPDLVIQEWGQDEVTLWKAAGLKNTDVLIYDPELKQAVSLLEKLGKAGIRFKREMHSGSLEVIRALTESGVGVGILPSRVAALAQPKLSIYKADAPKFPDRICLVYRPELRRTAGGRQLVEGLKAGRG